MEIDVHFVRKSVRAIGKLAIKIESGAEDCITCLLDLVATKVGYILQEATVVIKNIFRKYPNRYEGIISKLCENLDELDEPEAKGAIIWIIGQYADRIDNSDVLLDDFLFSFADDTVEVQLALLTATVKLFIQRPTKGQDLVVKVLKWATEDTDNPDLRDRGYMYWRLLSTNPTVAKQVVMGDKPSITAESEKLDPQTLEEMCLNVGTLSTIYLKPVHQVFRNARGRRIQDSPALQKHQLPTTIAREAQKNLPSIHGEGLPPLDANGQIDGKDSLAAAVSAADSYFASLTPGGAGQMDSIDDGVMDGAERQYVVNQNQPDQVYRPEVGDGNGDLLTF